MIRIVIRVRPGGVAARGAFPVNSGTDCDG